MKSTSKPLDPFSFMADLLEFLSLQEERGQILSQESDLDLATLSQEYMKPEIQADLCDFLLNHEIFLLEFCKNFSYSPEEIWRLRLKFPGFSE